MAKTSARGMLILAREYVDAAGIVIERLNENETPRAIAQGLVTSRPAYYLIGHGIELGLKAFLRSKGVTRNELKGPLNHNLEKCLKEAEKRGLPEITETLGDLLPVLNDSYKAKELEYMEYEGMKLMPKLGVLHAKAADFIDSITLSDRDTA